MPFQPGISVPQGSAILAGVDLDLVPTTALRLLPLGQGEPGRAAGLSASTRIGIYRRHQHVETLEEAAPFVTQFVACLVGDCPGAVIERGRKRAGRRACVSSRTGWPCHGQEHVIDTRPRQTLSVLFTPDSFGAGAVPRATRDRDDDSNHLQR